jgi:hypothetical protein
VSLDKSTNSSPFSIGRVTAYFCFFVAGAAVAIFQWHIIFDIDRSGLVQYYFEAIFLVPVFGIVGAALALVAKDSVLTLLSVATLLLFALQVLAERGPLPVLVLNGYARIYAASCLFATLALLLKRWPARVMFFVFLSALVIGFSAFVVANRNPAAPSQAAPSQTVPDGSYIVSVSGGGAPAIQRVFASYNIVLIRPWGNGQFEMRLQQDPGLDVVKGVAANSGGAVTAVRPIFVVRIK